MQQLSQAPIFAVALFAAAVLGTGPARAAEPPRVVASIAPIGSLAAAVMRDVGAPTVLLPAGASPHAYALRPSEARALASADLVLWVGEALEAFLEEPLETLAPKGTVVELMETDGLVLLPTRTGGVWEAGHDEHGHGDHKEHGKTEGHGHNHGHDKEHGKAEASDHGNIDAHLWLDPRNASVIVERIATALAERDPDRAATYRANAQAAKAALAALDRELAVALAPLRDRPYVVFHDAYQYLETRYGLKPLGAVTIAAERAPGAKRLARLREEIRERGAVCAFREPQFAPRVLDSLGADTGIRIGVLDPLGAGTGISPDDYPRLMRALATGIVACLTPAG
ncbi:MAG: zinc ABC transporter substrate-binding protein [Thalassobaculum sp.]|uniref:zinc ABC transporter substrate-binding protein n=1 Tax=Thalassobaculum sp. TaxID=2022740 RepID=UPI0032EE5984